MAQKRVKTAQINLRIAPALKTAAEKAAAADHRSLTGLIEKLLSDYCKKRGPTGGHSSPRVHKGAPKAAEMAGREVDRLGDASATSEERASRKRRLVSGPREFRDMRRK
jgi:hypothetical protein